MFGLMLAVPSSDKVDDFLGVVKPLRFKFVANQIGLMKRLSVFLRCR